MLELHEGLDKEEIRDFISINLIRATKAGNVQKENIPFDHKNPIEWAVKDCENDLRAISKRLAGKKDMLALVQIMRMLGWEDYDVCEGTGRSDEHDGYLNFIGTEAEYHSICEKLKIDPK